MADQAQIETLTLAQVLEQIESGRLSIPSFHRGLVWTGEQRLELLRSVLAGQPIGALSVVRVQHGEVASGVAQSLGPIVLPAPDPKGPVQLLVDGVQRVGAVLLARHDLPDPETSALLRYDLAANELISVPQDEAVSEHLAPLTLAFDTAARLGFQRRLDASSEPLRKRLDEMTQSLRDYRVPVVSLSEAAQDGGAAVFVRLNRQQASLSEEELAKNEAYRRIEAARWSGATELDLHSLGLTALPAELFLLTELQWLDLTGNQLGDLPPALGQLTNLRTLCLTANHLTALPVELGQLTSLQRLDLSWNRLTELPAELGQLTGLRTLSLTGNRLTDLPPRLAQLTNLWTIYLDDNRLTGLPPVLGQLASLRALGLIRNPLAAIPGLGQLTDLRMLYLQGAQLAELPAELGQLTNLRGLFLRENGLTTLPPELGQLTNLTHLDLANNRLAALPPELGQLTDLRELRLCNNPLVFPPPEVLAQSLAETLAFLRSVRSKEGTRSEAKLLILGDGGEGKTCLSRAIRGLPFQRQASTRGVNVERWAAPGGVTINLWDFEGQEINHQSHQFFLTKRSLYLVVFNGRRYVAGQLGRLEYWLETIRARAPGCRVLLVATECEERLPAVHVDTLVGRFPEQLAVVDDFFPIGCSTGRGVAELRDRILTLANDLELVPQIWPEAFVKAEVALRTHSDLESRQSILRAELYEVFAGAGIEPELVEGAARIFGDMGILTHFPDSAALREFVVLKPSWLTKAISRALEHPQLVADRGRLRHGWLRELWDEDYPGLFGKLFACLREFELCYPLDEPELSLVPLRFPAQPPAIPWSPQPDAVLRRIEYRFERNPPFGLMGRVIVKAHHLIVKTEAHPQGVYWHNGAFLESGSERDDRYSQAIVALDPEARVLRVEARALHPQAMVEQIDAFVKAVLAFLEGVQATRYYGCVQDDGSPCPNAHAEEAVAWSLRERTKISCFASRHHADPLTIVYGLHSFGDERDDLRELLRAELDREPEWAQAFGRMLRDLDARFDTIEKRLRSGSGGELGKTRLMLQQNQCELLNLLDARDVNRTPALFTIVPVRRGALNPERFFEERYRLHFYCEHGEQPHRDPTPWELERPRGWWQKSAPFLKLGLRVLPLVALAGQVAPIMLPELTSPAEWSAIEKDVKTTTAVAGLAGQLEADLPEDRWALRGKGRKGLLDRHDLSRCESARRAFNAMVKELFPDAYQQHTYGELRRILTPERRYRWLCPEHRKHFV